MCTIQGLCFKSQLVWVLNCGWTLFELLGQFHYTQENRSRIMKFVWLILPFLLCQEITESLSLNGVNWGRFITSQFYENTVLVIELGNPFVPQNLSKARPFVWARMECASSCTSQDSCQAFNFYETADFYVCELLADNFCSRIARMALQAWPGGSVWDKVSATKSTSCIDQYLEGKATADYCEAARPGCNGTWPACNDCVASCYQCRLYRSYSTAEFYKCTVWPAGSFLKPIFSACYNTSTFIIIRHVDPVNVVLKDFYVMPFADVERLSKLNVYRQIEFWFLSINEWSYLTRYNISYFHANGNISDMALSFAGNGGDGFNLNGQTTSLKFANVGNDTFSCGSFWVLDPTNDTYCPGGKTSLLGTPYISGTGDVVTGIRWPPAVDAKLYRTDVKLVV